MRREVLPYLACPNCRSGMQLGAVTREEGPHVIDGDLVCERGTCHFDVTGGVPAVLPGNVPRHRPMPFICIGRLNRNERAH